MAPHTSTRSTYAAQGEHLDDLSLIRHVGPGTVKRLQDGGVTSLAEIATTTPEQLAAASGYSASKIEKEDWIGQARRLVGGGEPSTSLVVAPRSDPSHRVATFRLEVTVEPGGKVHHSDITYLQDDTLHDHWINWNSERLTDFVRQAAGLVPTDSATDVESASEAFTLPDGPVVEPSRYRLELDRGDDLANRRALTHDDEVDIVLDVPLRGLVTRPAQPVRHRVEVSAVEVGGGKRHVIATSSATNQPISGELKLRLPASMPPAGLYRLRAELTVAAVGAKSTSKSARLRSAPILVH